MNLSLVVLGLWIAVPYTVAGLMAWWERQVTRGEALEGPSEPQNRPSERLAGRD